MDKTDKLNLDVLLIPTGECVKEPHHKPQRDGITDEDVMEQYMELINVATSIAICNYSSLNIAIDMGF